MQNRNRTCNSSPRPLGYKPAGKKWPNSQPGKPLLPKSPLRIDCVRGFISAWTQKSMWLKPHCRSHSSSQAELTRSTQRCTGKCGPRDLGHSSFSMGIENSVTTPWTSASSPDNNHATSPWEWVTGTNLNLHLNGHWLLLCQEQIPRLYYPHGPMPLTNMQKALLQNRKTCEPAADTTATWSKDQSYTPHHASSPHVQKSALGSILLRKRLALEEGCFL